MRRDHSTSATRACPLRSKGVQVFAGFAGVLELFGLWWLLGLWVGSVGFWDLGSMALGCFGFGVLLVLGFRVQGFETPRMSYNHFSRALPLWCFCTGRY